MLSLKGYAYRKLQPSNTVVINGESGGKHQYSKSRRIDELAKGQKMENILREVKRFYR